MSDSKYNSYHPKKLNQNFSRGWYGGQFDVHDLGAGERVKFLEVLGYCYAAASFPDKDRVRTALKYEQEINFFKKRLIENPSYDPRTDCSQPDFRIEMFPQSLSKTRKVGRVTIYSGAFKYFYDNPLAKLSESERTALIRGYVTKASVNSMNLRFGKIVAITRNPSIHKQMQILLDTKKINFSPLEYPDINLNKSLINGRSANQHNWEIYSMWLLNPYQISNYFLSDDCFSEVKEELEKKPCYFTPEGIQIVHVHQANLRRASNFLEGEKIGLLGDAEYFALKKEAFDLQQKIRKIERNYGMIMREGAVLGQLTSEKVPTITPQTKEALHLLQQLREDLFEVESRLSETPSPARKKPGGDWRAREWAKKARARAAAGEMP